MKHTTLALAMGFGLANAAPSAEVGADGSGAAQAVSTFVYSFNFRKVDATAYARLLEPLEGDDAAKMAARFEPVHEKAKESETPKLLGYKRKTEEYTLQLPSFVATLPSSLVADLIKSYIADFVRSQYIDNFEAPGQHDWAFIEKTVAESARRGGGIGLGSLPEATWEFGAKSFGEYITAATKNGEAGKRLASAFLAKFSPASFKKYLDEYNPVIVGKVRTRLENWAVWAVEQDGGMDAAEDIAKLQELLDGRLKKQVEEQKIDIGAIL